MDGTGNERRAGPFRLFLMSGILVAFTLAAAIGIIVWVPLLPEAAAVDIGNRADFAEYIVLHESWHSVAATSRFAFCNR